MDDTNPNLFPTATANAGEPAATPCSANDAKPAARLRLPQRQQCEMILESLDQRVEQDHTVRVVWNFVAQLDLSPWLERIKAVEGRQGRDANDPRMLLALWLFATIEGVGSARELDRLCREHRAYQWICGGVSVNYHTLADFRVQHSAFLEQLFAQSIASLTREGLVDVNLVAQDGMRIRASAGSDSFRREAALQTHLQQAEEHLTKLKTELEVNPNRLNARKQAAQLRAAREKQERLASAIDHVREIAASREKRKAGDGESARASSTDPEARRMKMPDGGTRPAYNAQFATAVHSGVIVGVATSNAGNDAHELEPMIEEIRDNTGMKPKEMLLDGGYSTKENIQMAGADGPVLYMPLREEKKQLEDGKNPYEPKPKDTEAMKDFRARMGEPESKAKYKLRGQTAEWTNAQARGCGLYMVRVRGKQQVQAVLVLFALGHNLLRAEKLRAELKK